MRTSNDQRTTELIAQLYRSPLLEKPVLIEALVKVASIAQIMQVANSYSSIFGFAVRNVNFIKRIAKDAPISDLLELLHTRGYALKTMATNPNIHHRLARDCTKEQLITLLKDDNLNSYILASKIIIASLDAKATTADLLSLVTVRGLLLVDLLGNEHIQTRLCRELNHDDFVALIKHNRRIFITLESFPQIKKRIVNDLQTQEWQQLIAEFPYIAAHLNRIPEIKAKLAQHETEARSRLCRLTSWAYTVGIHALTTVSNICLGHYAQGYRIDPNSGKAAKNVLKPITKETPVMLLYRCLLLHNVIEILPAHSAKEHKHITRQVMAINSRQFYSSFNTLCRSNILLTQSSPEHSKQRSAIMSQLRPSKFILNDHAINWRGHREQSLSNAVLQLFSDAYLGQDIIIPTILIDALKNLHRTVSRHPEINYMPRLHSLFNNNIRQYQQQFDQGVSKFIKNNIVAIERLLNNDNMSLLKSAIQRFNQRHNLPLSRISHAHIDALSMDKSLRSAITNLFPVFNLIDIINATINYLERFNENYPDYFIGFQDDEVSKTMIIKKLVDYGFIFYSNIREILRITDKTVTITRSDGSELVTMPANTVIQLKLHPREQQQQRFDDVLFSCDDAQSIRSQQLSFGVGKRRCPAEHTVARSIFSQCLTQAIAHFTHPVYDTGDVQTVSSGAGAGAGAGARR